MTEEIESPASVHRRQSLPFKDTVPALRLRHDASWGDAQQPDWERARSSNRSYERRERRGRYWSLFGMASLTTMLLFAMHVGYNPKTWADLRVQRPESSTEVRAYARVGSYYNHAYDRYRDYVCIELR